MFKNKYNHQLFYWHFEVSSKCSLKCPRCPRTEKPDQYKVTELNLEFFQKHFPVDFIQKEMLKVMFCGGQGDPIYCKELVDIVKYFKEAKPDIEILITTNGSYKSERWWSELGEVVNEYDSIIFRIMRENPDMALA